jgi:hypothetical protein
MPSPSSSLYHFAKATCISATVMTAVRFTTQLIGSDLLFATSYLYPSALNKCDQPPNYDAIFTTHVLAAGGMALWLRPTLTGLAAEIAVQHSPYNGFIAGLFIDAIHPFGKVYLDHIDRLYRPCLFDQPSNSTELDA